MDLRRRVVAPLGAGAEMKGIERIALVRKLEDHVLASYPDAADDDKLLAAAVCLLACTEVNLDVGTLVELTRYPAEFVSFLEANWRKSRVWDGEGDATRLLDAGWVGQERLADMFWQDVSVGLGWIRREWEPEPASGRAPT